MQSRAQAFVNMYSAMGTLEKYVELDPNAKKIASEKDMTIRFSVTDGPDGLIIFKGGSVKVIPYNKEEKTKVDVILKCFNPEAFNKVVDGEGTPIPLKGFSKVFKYMMKPDQMFNVLTKNMAETMRKKEFNNAEEKALTTRLAFYAMVGALAQIANEDELGQISAKAMADGEISLEIKDDTYATIIVKDHKLTCVREKAKNPRAFMVFGSIDIAKGLIDGELDAMTCICNGGLELKGYVALLEQLNKVLNLVPKYLS